MISPGERAADLLSAFSLLALLFYLAGRRLVILVGFFFIIFTLAWRTSATAFIDLAGPVYSSQLERSIGPGTVIVIHSIAYFLVLIPFLYCFRQSAVEQWREGIEQSPRMPGEVTLADLTFAASLLLVLFLFFDLVHRGSIPFFSRIERFNNAGGPAHRWMIKYGNFVVFWWGLIFAAGYVRYRRLDWRPPSLLLLLAICAFLTGNRFSAFYSQFSFFITPWAAVIAMQTRPSDGWFSWIRRGLVSRTSQFAAVAMTLAAAGIVSFAVYNNLANVRGYKQSEIWRQAFERTMIQPSKIGWTSFERVFQNDRWKPSLTFHFLFQEPIDPNRNTSIQYLMLQTIDEPRTTDQIRGGFQLAGGFPEIFFELFGPYFAWPFLLGAGWITASLSAYMVRGIVRGDYTSAFLALYVLFGVYVMYIGGMLNFVLPATYWLKIWIFALVLSVEQSLGRIGLPLLPWVLFQRSALMNAFLRVLPRGRQRR